jgi:hypothetical protein
VLVAAGWNQLVKQRTLLVSTSPKPSGRYGHPGGVRLFQSPMLTMLPAQKTDLFIIISKYQKKDQSEIFL